MNYDEAIKDITSAGKFHINLGLERIFKLLEFLGNPQDDLKCVQVAGTNGKGSVCAIFSSVLKEAGYKVGLYTSPHIFDYTERIKINDVDISKTDFSKYYTNIIKFSKKNNINPTEFEILTAIMYKYFAERNVDIAIIETGLGGRFDATNVLRENICSVITHIDLDHTDRLGDTKEKIAFEKAGIIKPKSYVFTSEGYEVIKERADELNSMLVLSQPFFDSDYVDSLSLKGDHQKDNLALVLSVVDTLFSNIDKKTIINGLKKVKHPCRFQYIKDKNLLVDGAHNPNCFEALRNSLDRYFPNIKRNYVFGCLNTKNYEKMLSYITSDPNLNQLYIYTFNNPNSVDYNVIKDCVKVPCQKLDSLSELYSSKTLTVICGSFYMINELVPKDILL